MGFHDLAANGESEARAARIGFGLAALNEYAEHRFQLVLRDAGAVIGDGAAQGLTAVWQVAIGKPDTHSIAARGKLGGIGNEVDHGLDYAAAGAARAGELPKPHRRNQTLKLA